MSKISTELRARGGGAMATPFVSTSIFDIGPDAISLFKVEESPPRIYDGARKNEKVDADSLLLVG